MKAFWQGRTVLVTGHTGFKGMWLSIVLAEMGAKVIGLSKTDLTDKRLYTSVDSNKIFHEEIFCDIRETKNLAKLIKKVDPEVVFHLAAQPLVRASYTDPIETYETNVVGTASVLNGIRHSTRCRDIICVTSDKCYNNVEQIWGYRESDPLGGKDPYSASKGASEIIAYSMWHSFLKDKGINMATLRAGNVVGGGDYSADRIMTDVVNAYLTQSPLLLRNPTATRPWQHVLEPVFSYLLLVSDYFNGKTAFYDSFNIGPEPGNIKSVADLTNEVQKKWNITVETLLPDDQKLHEANLLSLDNTKIKYETIWKPKWGFETTIDKTLNWYQQYSSGRDALDLCRLDISQYIGER